MGVPSVLPLPAAASDRTGCPSCRPWGRMLLWTALLVLAPAASAAGTPSPQAGPPKAVVRLEPPWLNVLRGDEVTLHCQGPHGPGDGPTQWSRDGAPIPAQVQPRFSFRANLSDGGDYRCQTGQTGLSDPVRLNVTSGWLLLQTPRLLLQEGDPLLLRCHSWQNRPLFKIQFLQDSVSRWYSPANSSFFVPHANVSHGGTYHCSGFIGKMKHKSEPVSITVPDDSSFPVTIVVAVVVVIAVVAAVAAVAAWVCLRRSQSAGAPESREVGETPPEEPAPCDAEPPACAGPRASEAACFLSGKRQRLREDAGTAACGPAGAQGGRGGNERGLADSSVLWPWVSTAAHSRLPPACGRAPADLFLSPTATLTPAEEAAKTEAENTITYSLLMHPEEDAGLSDYQNM
ncbi:low affinity immunoglobulin gamma Fc region receptor II-b [Phyllostomus discolor]|uniref:low affinity immunoglobulin gamma Fc region receptor II-b n=1 Tax=Phyllostomus discolor TaxID=89673 RepID=UPI0016583ED8|nr:low affinity immunoglobulin gamma Fc region receptor II-b [Phyllostomus discolor]